MSYGRTWNQCSEHPKLFHERSEAEQWGLQKEFDTNFDRLHAQGHFVIISAGKNFAFEEIFLFATGADAQEFYESGYLKWERFSNDDDEGGLGFDQVAIYSSGNCVASKSCQPSAPSEQNRAASREWWQKVGKFTCDVLDEEQ